MLSSNLELLRHIKEEVDFILQYTQAKTKDEVVDDAVLCRAIIRI